MRELVYIVYLYVPCYFNGENMRFDCMCDVNAETSPPICRRQWRMHSIETYMVFAVGRPQIVLWCRRCASQRRSGAAHVRGKKSTASDGNFASLRLQQIEMIWFGFNAGNTCDKKNPTNAVLIFRIFATLSPIHNFVSNGDAHARLCSSIMW